MPVPYFHKCSENASFVKTKNMNFAGAIYNGKNKIKNIIFDWGGVITDLHFEVTRKAFIEMGLEIFDETTPHDPRNNLFIPFEIGKITPDEFRNHIKKETILPITDEMIDKAWTSLLGELPEDRYRILQKASQSFHTYLLSNTNAIHKDYYYAKIRSEYHMNGFDPLFIKTYFSHELGLRKPNDDIFLHVLSDAGIRPEETVFIDDFLENIETALKLGFHTIHLKAPLTLRDVFVDY
jgi:glucose-1-phosphatase